MTHIWIPIVIFCAIMYLIMIIKNNYIRRKEAENEKIYIKERNRRIEESGLNIFM